MTDNDFLLFKNEEMKRLNLGDIITFVEDEAFYEGKVVKIMIGRRNVVYLQVQTKELRPHIVLPHNYITYK